MKTLKVYGVTGLLEWNAIIPCNNGVKLHVHFEGGSLSSWGSIPAKYYTDDEVVQALLESSDFFKKGKIKLLRTIQKAQPAVAPKSAPKPKVAPKPVEAPAPVKAPVAEQPAEATAPTEAPSSAEETPTEGEEAPAEAVAEENTATGLKVVKVADVEGEGKKYLMDNFGLKPAQLRGLNAIQAQAKTHGIEFVTE